MNAIDTNVWLYSHDTRDAHKQAVAQSLIAKLRSLALPWQVGCEFIAAIRKLAPLGFDAEQAWAALADMQSMANAVLMPVPQLWAAAQEGCASPPRPVVLGCFARRSLHRRGRNRALHRGHGLTPAD